MVSREMVYTNIRWFELKVGENCGLTTQVLAGAWWLDDGLNTDLFARTHLIKHICMCFFSDVRYPLCPKFRIFRWIDSESLRNYVHHWCMFVLFARRTSKFQSAWELLYGLSVWLLGPAWFRCCNVIPFDSNGYPGEIVYNLVHGSLWS